MKPKNDGDPPNPLQCNQTMGGKGKRTRTASGELAKESPEGDADAKMVETRDAKKARLTNEAEETLYNTAEEKRRIAELKEQFPKMTVEEFHHALSTLLGFHHKTMGQIAKTKEELVRFRGELEDSESSANKKICELLDILLREIETQEEVLQELIQNVKEMNEKVDAAEGRLQRAQDAFSEIADFIDNYRW